MRAHADRPTQLAEVAAAAGCSLRAPHAVFRRFRGTTSLAAPHAARLEEARAALARAGEGARVMEVARRFGEPLPRDRDRTRAAG